MKIITVVALAVVALTGSSSALKDEGKPQVRIFAGYVTRTRFNVLTSTTLLSCVSTIERNAACQGRKKRSHRPNLVEEFTVNEANEQQPLLLHGSEGEHSVEKREAAQNQRGKLFVSLTTFTTMTTTSFTANTATTVSVSFHCIPPDPINLPFCG